MTTPPTCTSAATATAQSPRPDPQRAPPPPSRTRRSGSRSPRGAPDRRSRCSSAPHSAWRSPATSRSCNSDVLRARLGPALRGRPAPRRARISRTRCPTPRPVGRLRRDLVRCWPSTARRSQRILSPAPRHVRAGVATPLHRVGALLHASAGRRRRHRVADRNVGDSCGYDTGVIAARCCTSSKPSARAPGPENASPPHGAVAGRAHCAASSSSSAGSPSRIHPRPCAALRRRAPADPGPPTPMAGAHPRDD